jgi:hypothetical protein
MFAGFVRLAGMNLQLEAKGSDFRGFSEGGGLEFGPHVACEELTQGTPFRIAPNSGTVRRREPPFAFLMPPLRAACGQINFVFGKIRRWADAIAHRGPRELSFCIQGE